MVLVVVVIVIVVINGVALNTISLLSCYVNNKGHTFAS